MTTFWAAEPHICGTTVFAVGDTREADETEVKHLVDLGVLSTQKVNAPALQPATEGSEKSETGADQNKSEGKAPANKSA